MSASTLRVEQKRALSKIELFGDVLDVGGDRNSGYISEFAGEFTPVVANINCERYGADIEFDAEYPWPVEASSFDAVTLLNVLEHIFDFKTVLRESFRVLRTGGRVVIVVPFMYKVHGSPSDYHRFTAFALERHLRDAGFSDIDTQVLGTGYFSVMFHTIGSVIRIPLIVRAGQAISSSIDRLFAKLRPLNNLSAEYYPIGYCVTAAKP